jgi:hypothetical protein
VSHPQKISAQLTSTLVSAISNLERRDFVLGMGSGLIISIADLEGRSVTEPFMINTEDMQDIKPHIIKSIKRVLKLRLASLQADIRSIEQILPPVDHNDYEELIDDDELPDDDENDGGQGPFGGR